MRAHLVRRRLDGGREAVDDGEAVKALGGAVLVLDRKIDRRGVVACVGGQPWHQPPQQAAGRQQQQGGGHLKALSGSGVPRQAGSPVKLLARARRRPATPQRPAASTETRQPTNTQAGILLQRNGPALPCKRPPVNPGLPCPSPKNEALKRLLLQLSWHSRQYAAKPLAQVHGVHLPAPPPPHHPLLAPPVPPSPHPTHLLGSAAPPRPAPPP